MPVSEAFLEERKHAIGGSDVLHLAGLPPYGCVRRLWYDKSGVAPDFPFLGNPHTERGVALEPFAQHLYAKATGREVRQPPWQVSAVASFAGCHADGIQRDPDREGMGLLEIKCPTGRTYYAVRSRPEPPNEAVLQAQWGMMVHELTWGTVLLFCADAWEFRHWDIEADTKMQQDLLRLAWGFWPSVSNPKAEHPRLAPTDSRCKGCPWRKTCQGLDGGGDVAEAEADLPAASVFDYPDPGVVRTAMLDYIAAKAQHRDARASLELACSVLTGLFPGPGRIRCDLGEVKLTVIRKRGYTSVVPETTYRQLRVIPNQVEESSNDGEDTDY